MDFAAKHIEFVLACYGISAALLVIMTIAVVLRSKQHDRQLAMLEKARGRANNSKKAAS